MMLRMPLTALRRRRRRAIAAKLTVDYGPRFFDRHELKRATSGPVATTRRCRCRPIDLGLPQCAEETEPGADRCLACRDFCDPPA